MNIPELSNKPIIRQLDKLLIHSLRLCVFATLLVFIGGEALLVLGLGSTGNHNPIWVPALLFSTAALCAVTSSTTMMEMVRLSSIIGPETPAA